MMMQRAVRVFAVLSIVLFLQAGCAGMETGREATGSSTVVKELAKSTRSWDGNVLPAYLKGQPEVTILKITIPAGTRLDYHFHPVINAGVLTRGQLTVVTTGGKTLRLKAGDPIVEVVNTVHYGINEGDVPAEIIVFYAGVTGTPITVVQER